MRNKTLSAFPGQLVQLMVATVDQYGNYRPSYANHCNGLTCSHDTTIFTCTALNTSIYNETSDFTIRSGGLCANTNYLTVEIIFEECPRGFQLDSSGSKCECDQRLTALSRTQCNIDNQTIETTLWLYYQNETLYVWKFCYSNYCYKATSYRSIRNMNGSQCVNNHAGIICGGCRNTFTIAIGSSKCIKCSQKYAFLWLAPLFAVMGLILVLSMLFLDLTVSIGLINGLIFYANILSISSSINSYNCPIHPLLSVFISWVNLDFGIKTCFYSGMDMYQKIWLQFAFPLYIWLLVGLIIILSHYSTRVMRLLGRRVIPVLATLFLLSYIKILRIVIIVFTSSEVLKGDADNTSDELVPRKVWTSDGNVDYLSGKHIPLFIVALLFLVVLFLPYTLFLTFGQCLHFLPRRKWLRCLQSTAFISIMDAYHAPFNRKHRYWTGLLLLIRCILFIVTLYANNIDNISIFIFIVFIIGLFAFKILVKDGIYRNTSANNFEHLFLLNLILLAITITYLKALDGPTTRVCKCITASISVALVTFCAIIVYHISYKVKDYDMVQKFLSKIKTARKAKSSVNHLPVELQTATTTIVELRESLLESTNHEI